MTLFGRCNFRTGEYSIDFLASPIENAQNGLACAGLWASGASLENHFIPPQNHTPPKSKELDERMTALFNQIYDQYFNSSQDKKSELLRYITNAILYLNDVDSDHHNSLARVVRLFAKRAKEQNDESIAAHLIFKLFKLQTSIMFVGGSTVNNMLTEIKDAIKKITGLKIEEKNFNLKEDTLPNNIAFLVDTTRGRAIFTLQ